MTKETSNTVKGHTTTKLGCWLTQMAWTLHLGNGSHGGRTLLYQLTRSNRTTWQPSTCCSGDGSLVQIWWCRGAFAEASEHHVWKAQLSLEGLMILIDLNPEWSLINVICWQLVIINGNANSIIPQGDNY